MLPKDPVARLEALEVRLGDIAKTAEQIPTTDKIASIYRETILELAKQGKEIASLLHEALNKK